MYRLVALDVDGTLLDSSHRLTPRVRDAIHIAQRRGAIVCLATGKLLVSVGYLLDELRLDGLQITCNGAALMSASSGQPSQTWPLTHEHAELAATAIHDLAPDIGIAWYTTDAIYTNAPHGPLDDVLASYQEPALRHVQRLGDKLPTPLKLLVTGDQNRLLTLRDQLSERIGTILTVSRTTADFVEVMAPAVSKGAALHALAQRLGVAHEDIAAIGDGENDISLLQAAGMGIAMGNAMPALLAHAAHTTRSNDDDGVAHAFAYLGLA